ncbi:uncharacterized protein Z518_09772 [Rhinocladiella mackenziei CBS 650.93]|uniref:DNA (cytosine-5-)-methyltransferase n=1 Tax=Rhinocladiella mackenziei CBS 650.93 TaxID=1442369 RepID=A0A0D2FFB7_9EURO|nr:uncharacterized protein Z518_09772 [Rhinocladiella mackenziei CBS 650.93]KIX00707.1 hypothetical protein Z518_09772 [Rhinocladiella mackenziei CBS 650.93]
MPFLASSSPVWLSDDDDDDDDDVVVVDGNNDGNSDAAELRPTSIRNLGGTQSRHAQAGDVTDGIYRNNFNSYIIESDGELADSDYDDNHIQPSSSEEDDVEELDSGEEDGDEHPDTIQVCPGSNSESVQDTIEEFEETFETRIEDFNATFEYKRTRSRTDKQRSDLLAPTSSSPFYDLHFDEHFTQNLKALESPRALKLLYPPKFSGSSYVKPDISEAKVLDEFIEMGGVSDTEPDDHFFEFDLWDFHVYRAPYHSGSFEGQFDSLHIVASEINQDLKSQKQWFVDGTLECMGKLRPISDARIVDVSIGPLDQPEEHETQVWIMTEESRKVNHWYRLKAPSKEYTKMWSDFIWLSNLNKYVIDYLEINSETGVSLADFKGKFWAWLKSLHGDNISAWHDKCGNRTDFRKDLADYGQFFRNQTYSLCVNSNDMTKMSYPVWSEIGCGNISQDQQAASKWTKTSVTPEVATSFSKFWKNFDLLEPIQFCPAIENQRKQKIMERNFPSKLDVNQSKHFIKVRNQQIPRSTWILEEAAKENRPVRIFDTDEIRGKVIILRSQLKTGQHEFNYAWVRSVSRGYCYVVWLVLPSDTAYGSPDRATFYPVGNELFFSNQCNCEKVSLKDIVKIIDASVFKDHAEKHGALFVHNLLYCEGEEMFIAVSEIDLMRCQCKAAAKKKRCLPRSQPNHRNQKMQTLSLFSGCGLLDYAFVSPGHAETKFAIDHWETAILSHRANDEAQKTRREIGSTSDCFEKFASGEGNLPDNIDCVIGGCPCDGYSPLNAHRETLTSQKNCSLLANMLSWIQMLMPTYVLIENVPNMDKGRPNACSQAICFLVALGYQVRKSLVVDSEVGGASSRQRLFIVAAAPGFILPEEPERTHGPTGSGLRKIRTIRETISDLPPLHNDTIINPANPDHIPLKRFKVDFQNFVNFRGVVSRIPTRPPNMSLSKTYRDGGLLPHERCWFRTLHKFQQTKGSKSLTRVDPDNPFRTICTVISPMDAVYSGIILHPFQHRTLSLLEASRAMGKPDSFILVGTVSEQFKQLGNAVPWALGAAWGRVFGRAWQESLERRTEDNTFAAILAEVRQEAKEQDEAGEKMSAKSTSRAGMKRSQQMRVSDNADSDSSIEVIIECPVKRKS